MSIIASTPYRASADSSNPAVSFFERSGSWNPSQIQNIQSWLLNSKVQLTEGPHLGGVSGWLDEEGSPEFVYPEVTGYYLVWLAFLSALSYSGEKTASRAKIALGWVSAQFAEGNIPPTRLYLQSACEDWRNSVVFSFDAAMLARGIALAPHLELETSRGNTLAQVLNWLGRFTSSDGLIRPYLAAQPKPVVPVPETWSAAAGPHQMKLAAAIRTLPSDTVPQNLAAAAEKLYWLWRYPFPSPRLSGPTHPILYYLEGLLVAAASGIDAEAWSLAASVYASLMEAQWPEGSLPSNLDDTGAPLRSDVLAQALRIGCILRSRGHLSESRWEGKLAALAASLGLFVQNDGSVRFSQDGLEPHRNTWSAIFTHQALCFFETLSSGETIPDDWQKLLV